MKRVAEGNARNFFRLGGASSRLTRKISKEINQSRKQGKKKQTMLRKIIEGYIYRYYLVLISFVCLYFTYNLSFSHLTSICHLSPPHLTYRHADVAYNTMQ